MSEFAYPLDGEQNYTAAQCGAFFAGRTSGVFAADGNLAVSVTGARQLTLSAGIAWINTDRFWGKVYCNTDAMNFVLPTADGALDMICRVVVRWNKTTNKCQALLLEGTPSSSPVAPARSMTDELYDLVLADYLVQHGETEASAARLTDRRLDESLCGLVRDGVERIPTDTLNSQAEALIDALTRAAEQAASLQLADGAVTTAKLAGGAVTPAKTTGIATLNSDGKVVADQATSARGTNITASRSLTAEDNGKLFLALSANVTITIPTGLPLGMEVEVCRFSDYTVTFAAASGVTVRSVNGALRIANKYGCAVLKKATADDQAWLLAGDLA